MRSRIPSRAAAAWTALLLSVPSMALAGSPSSYELEGKIQEQRTSSLLQSLGLEDAPAASPVSGADANEVDPFGDFQQGVRHDFRNAPDKKVREPSRRRPRRARKPRRRSPPPPPPETWAFSLDPSGERVWVREDDLRRLGPPPPPTPSAPPAPPSALTLGEATLEVDVPRGRASLLWTFHRLPSKEIPRLRTDLPPALHLLELDGKPAAVDADGGIPIPTEGVHRLALEYPLEHRLGPRGDRLRVPVPEGPLLEVRAVLPGTRLAVRIPGARALTQVEGSGRTRVEARVAPTSSLQVLWEERIAGLAPRAATEDGREPDLTGGSLAIHTLDGPDLDVRVRARWVAGDPGVNRLALDYPRELTLLEVRDGSGQPWPEVAVVEREGERQLVLGLAARRTGELVAQVHLAARPEALRDLRSGREVRRLPLPSVAPADVDRPVELVAIVTDSRTSAELVPPDAAQPRDRTEIPGWAQGFLPERVSHLARRAGDVDTLALAIEPLRSEPPQYFEVGDVEALTLLTERDRAALHRVTFSVQNSAEQFLEVRLPPGARIRGATVRDQPVKPGRPRDAAEDDRRVLIALSPGDPTPSGAPRPYPVSVVYQTPLPDLGGTTSVRLELARTALDSGRAVWKVLYPPSLAAVHVGGSFRERDAGLSRGLGERIRSAERKLVRVARKSKRLQTQGMLYSNVMAPPPPSDSEAARERRDMGLLPVEVQFPSHRSMPSLVLEQDAVGAGGSAWDARLAFTERSVASWANTVSGSLLGLAALLGLLALAGCARPRTAGIVAGLAALSLAGLGFSGMLRLGAHSLGLGVGVLGALLYALSTPVRRLHSPASLAAVLLLATGVGAAPRIEALVPIHGEELDRVVRPRDSRRVLVPRPALEGLREEAKRRPEPAPAPTPVVLFGEQTLEGAAEDGGVRLILRLPLRVEGAGTARVPVLEADAAPLKAERVDPRGRRTPVVLEIRADASYQEQERAARGHYARLLKDAESAGDARARAVRWDMTVEGPGEGKAESWVLELLVWAPVEVRADGGQVLVLEPPPASARQLELRLPDEIRVEVEGDPEPRLEARVEETLLRATPARRGPVRVTWYPRARHRRAAPEPPRRAPAPSRESRAPPRPPATPEVEEPLLLLTDWSVAVEAGEDALRGVAQADLRLLQGAAESLTLVAPDAMVLTEVTGLPRARPPVARELPGGTTEHRIPLGARLRQDASMTLHFRVPLEGDATDAGAPRPAEIPLPRLVESRSTRGRVGLRRMGNLEVRPLGEVGVEPSPLEEGEVLAFSWSHAAGNAALPALRVAVEAHSPAQVYAAAVIGGSATTRIGRGNLREVDLVLRVRTNGRKHLAFTLPEGTREDSLTVHVADPGSRTPRRIGNVFEQTGALRVGLPQPPSRSREPIEAEVHLSLRREGAPLGGWSGSASLELPQPDVPVAGRGLEWRVELDGGYVVTTADLGGSQDPEHPYASGVRLPVRGLLPGAARLEATLAYLDEDLVLGIQLLLLLGAALLAWLVPLLVLGRVDLGLAPRVVLLAGLLAAALATAESGVPLHPEVLWIGGGLGLGLACVGFLRGRSRVLLGLLAATSLSGAPPEGLDLRYLPDEALAARLETGEWEALPARELHDLFTRAHPPRPPPRPAPEAPRAHRVRRVDHVVDVRGEAVVQTSTYVLVAPAGPAAGLLLDVGAEAALEEVVALDAGGGSTPLEVVPAGGPGSPRRGHPRPGHFRVLGLSPRGATRLRVRTRRPLMRQGETRVFRVTSLRAPVGTLEVTLAGIEGDVDAEIFPAVGTRVVLEGGHPRVTAALRPASTYAVRVTPRRRSLPLPDDGPAEEVGFDVSLYTHWTLDAQRLEGRLRIPVQVTSGEVDRLVVTAPEDVTLVDLVGPQVASSSPLPPAGGRSRREVLFRSRVRGSFTLTGRALRVLPEESVEAERRVRLLELGDIRVADAERQQGEIRLDLPHDASVRELAMDGAARIDPREAAPPAPAGSLVLRYLAPGVTFRVRTERLPRPAAHDLVGRAAAAAVVPLDAELAAVTVRYSLENRGYQSLRLRLPPEAQLVSARVDGAPVKPGVTADGESRIPLSMERRPAHDRAFPVEVVYVAPAPDSRMTLPALLDAPLDRVEVLLHHPRHERLRAGSGDWRTARRTPDFFAPVREAATLFPTLVAGVVTAPVWVPYSLRGGLRLYSASSTRSSAPRRELSAPGGMAGRGGAGFADDADMAPAAALDELQEPMPEEEGARPRSEARRRPRAPARQRLPAPPEPEPRRAPSKMERVRKLLASQGAPGALPVPLEFHPGELAGTLFVTGMIPRGATPELTLHRLPRWKRRAWLLLAGALAFLGALLGLGGGAGRRVWAPLLLLGLGLGLCATWTYGLGVDTTWGSAVAGAVAGLADRWRRARRSAAPAPSGPTGGSGEAPENPPPDPADDARV